MTPRVRSVGKKPVRNELGLGGRLYGGAGLLGASVDSEKGFREGNVEV